MSRLHKLLAASTTVVALALTACGPTDSSDTKADSQPTTSSTSKNKPSDVPTQDTDSQDNSPAGNVSDPDYVCAQFTGDEVTALLGRSFKLYPVSADMHLPAGMSQCTYKLVDDESKWFTIDYKDDSNWDMFRKNAKREPSHRFTANGDIIVKGPNGHGYILHDGKTILTINDFRLADVVGQNKFQKLVQDAPNQIN